MEQLFNFSMWAELMRRCSPAEFTRAWFAQWVKPTKTD